MNTLDRARHEHSIVNIGFPDINYINELSIIELKLKALEIIKEKNKIIDENIIGGCLMYMELTKEEYELLKEVLL